MLTLLLGLTGSVHAFCGTFIGGAGSEFFNEYAQVAIVRDGTQTTLSVVNDIQTDDPSLGSFALVIPVPEVITEENANVLEPALFDRLDQYSMPRLVTYECEDFEEDTGWMLDSAPEASEGMDSGGVSIEAQYAVGEYEIVILSATGAEGLYEWLNNNGFAVPGQSQPLLQEYIDQGQYFLAAKVSDTSLSEFGIESGSTLSPLQFTYQSSAFQIPIRIGTLNAKSEQDLVIYAINPYDNGMAGISNYREFSFEDECMWETQGEEFGRFVADQFSSAYEEEDSAGWMLEYAWGGGGCDPCTGTPPDGTDLVSLGMNEEYVHYGQYYFTRLHMRYTPQQVQEEVMLYSSNIFSQEQIRYIEYKPELEDRFPVCGVGMVEDPNSCDEIPGEPSSDPNGTEVENDDELGEGNDSPSEEGCNCATSTSNSNDFTFTLLGLLSLVVLRRRT